MGNVIGVRAAHHDGGTPIDHGVPYLANLVISGIVGEYHLALHFALQRVHRILSRCCHVGSSSMRVSSKQGTLYYSWPWYSMPRRRIGCGLRRGGSIQWCRSPARGVGGG